MKEKALDDIFDEVSRLIILSGLLPIRRSCDKGKKFGNIISEFQKENNTYGEVFSSITLLFKDETYKDTIKILKRIVKNLKKDMKNNKL